jgi:sucrose-6-phosphate hydrolase SacC (GH32 family)
MKIQAIALLLSMMVSSAEASAPAPTLAATAVSDAAPSPLYRPMPVIHFTPPCYLRAAGWHDTAGALLHPVTKAWHVFVGPVWQHLTTTNLVDWTVAGIVTGMGGSGTLIYDSHRNITVGVTGAVTAFTAESQDLSEFKSAGQIFKTVDPLDPSIGCWDPVIWFDERDQKYYAMGACGHNTKGGYTGTGGYGLQQYFSSPDWAKGWQQLPAPFLEWHSEMVPRVGSWNRTHEFVTPDFFPLGSKSTVFLTTTYGGLMQTGLNTTVEDGKREYDYSNYLIGPRPLPGGAFVPDESKSGPFDWSPFKPVADADSKNLTFATSKGMEQFGCCPKTAGDSERRVLFGWINNGWDQGPGEPDRTPETYSNNTLSLPRDLSVTPSGHMRQRFVPELAKLRKSNTHVSKQLLKTGGVPKAQFVAGGSGLQLEVVATFSRDPMKPLGPGKFGLLVFAAANLSEYTAIAFDSAREHFLLDRSHSGLALDEDVRGGPWPEPAAGSVTVHAYVDHAVVEMIANATLLDSKTREYMSDESTAIAAWVAPTSPAHAGVALFSEVDGVALESLDVWQLAAPEHLV